MCKKRRTSVQKNVIYPQRIGTRPVTTDTNPHRQLDQHAPLELQEKLFARIHALPGIRIEASGIPEFNEEGAVAAVGTRAFVLDETLAKGPREAFLVGTEFAHIHSAPEGALHLCLPDSVRQQVLDGGWGEPHPLAGQVIQGFHASPDACLIFGPRTEDEFNTIWQIVQDSYAFARGESIVTGL
jgi:phospholipase/carboxylesterase